MAEGFNYGRYLASREWAVLKVKVRQRSGGICERCRMAPHEETHHVTYERIGRERLEDLQGVCHRCHQFVSGKSDSDPCSPPVFEDPILETQRLDHDAQPSITGTALAKGMAVSTPEQLTEWNTDIQRLIVGLKAYPHLVFRLAQIKLRINQQFYQSRALAK